MIDLKMTDSKRRLCYAYTVTLYTTSYKCIGASDNIFDHFIFLNSVPTIPITNRQSSPRLQHRLLTI